MSRKRPPSRTERWRDAVARAREAHARLDAVLDDLESALGDLNDVKGEYEEWFENLPESLRNGAVGEKLQAIVNIEVPSDPRSETADALDELISGAEAADLPLGFGRD